MGRRRKEPKDTTTDVVIGSLISDARLSKKVSAVRLANQVGISKQMLYSYETGSTSCTVRVLLKFAEALDVEVYQLIPKASKILPTLQSRQKKLK